MKPEPAVAVVQTAAELESLAPRWRELLDAAARPEPVSTPAWLLPWWRLFGAGRELRVITVNDASGALIALAPFSRRRVWHRGAIPFRRLELLPSGEAEGDEISSDYIGVVVRKGRDEEAARAIVAALRTPAVGGWDDIVMPAMSGEDAFPAVFAAELRAAGIAVAVEPFGTCPYAALPATWDAYLAALDGNARYFVRRTIRDFTAWADPLGHTFTRADTAAAIAEARDVLQHLHQERWKGKGAFGSPLFSAFHEAVITAFAAGDGGAVDLWCLKVGGRPIAALYNIRYGGKIYFYQGGRSLDVPRNVRAGVMAHLLAIQAAIREGRREYDFLNGPSTYKRQLATGTHPLVTLRAVSPSHRSALVDRLRTTSERAAAAVRQRRRRTDAGDE